DDAVRQFFAGDIALRQAPQQVVPGDQPVHVPSIGQVQQRTFENGVDGYIDVVRLSPAGMPAITSAPATTTNATTLMGNPTSTLGGSKENSTSCSPPGIATTRNNTSPRSTCAG